MPPVGLGKLRERKSYEFGFNGLDCRPGALAAIYVMVQCSHVIGRFISRTKSSFITRYRTKSKVPVRCRLDLENFMKRKVVNSASMDRIIVRARAPPHAGQPKGLSTCDWQTIAHHSRTRFFISRAINQIDHSLMNVIELTWRRTHAYYHERN